MSLGIVCLLSFKAKEPKNYYKVSDTLYRSAQVKGHDLAFIKLIGIKTVLNLRNHVKDKCVSKDSALILIKAPMRTAKISEEEMVSALIAYRDAQKPVLVHCRRGIDRTGAFVACYRMVFENWSRKDAITEFLDPKFGYSKKLFPEVLEFLKEVDEEQLKEKVLGK